MSVLNYNEFINEATVAQLQEGLPVLFTGRFNIGGYNMVDLAGKTGVVYKIHKYQRMPGISSIEFQLDEPIKNYMINKKGRFELNTNQLRNIKILDDKATEEWRKQQADKQALLDQKKLEKLRKEEELKRKIESGEIAPFKASKEFLTLLRKIGFKVKEKYYDVSYFDIVKDKMDSVSFVPSKKSLGEDFEKFAQQTRIGRILKKLNDTYTDKQIENFVNLYKAEIEFMISEPLIEVVTGKDEKNIKYWYLEDRYAQGGGSLNNSCMRYKTEQESITFYDAFPDKIALAINRKGEKLIARALIWRLDDGRIYMDRIYSVNAASGIQLDRFAVEHRMLRFDHLGKKSGDLIVTLPNGQKWLDKHDVELPYFDSFEPYFPNRKKGKEKDKDFILKCYH